MTRAERIRMRANTPRDAVDEQRAKAKNGRPKLFIGPQDAAVMLRCLRASVSSSSPRGLACAGKIERTKTEGLWVCETQDLVTGEPRGLRWIQRQGQTIRVLRADPREAA